MQAATAAAGVLDLVERGMHQGRDVLDRLQVRVHSWRLAVDPATRVWTQEIRAGVADGSLATGALDRDGLVDMLEATRPKPE